MILNDIQIGLSRFSPKQKAEGKLATSLHLRHGCRLGWFIDPDDRSVLVFHQANSQNCYKEASACHPEGELELTAEQVFDGLRWEASQFSQILQSKTSTPQLAYTQQLDRKF